MGFEREPRTVTDAVILMAGIGSRLGTPSGAIAKPLVRIGGRPLICYTLDALQSVGVRTVHTVMGATSERLSEELEPLIPAGLRLNVIVNHEWQKQNGVSVLCADGKATAPFFLVMGDHLFEAAILATLLAEGDRGQVNLAVDRKITSIFDYLRRAQRNGDCSLSDGIRLMAADQKVRAVDIGEEWWQDVDTPEMLARAEQESARLLRDGGGRLAQERVAGER